MITELVQLADLNGLTGCDSTRQRRIHWFIDLDSQGCVVGFSPTVANIKSKKGQTVEDRGKRFATFANYHMQWKNDQVQGVCTNDSNWMPDLLSGPAAEVFPAGVRGTHIHSFRPIRAAIRADGKKHKDRQRLSKCRLWRRLMLRCADDNRSVEGMAAIAAFLRRPRTFADVRAFIDPERRDDVLNLLEKTGPGEEILSFRVNGHLIAADASVRRWWSDQVVAQRQEVMRHLPVGSDLYQDGSGVLTEYFPSITANIALASFNAAPFESYGLGKQTSTMRIETAEKCAAALRCLLDGSNTSLSFGDHTAVFWAIPSDKTRACEVPFVAFLARSDPLQVRDFLAGVWGSHPKQINTAPFHAALLHVPSQGRFSVHSWHSETLRDAEQYMRSYFTALTLGISEYETPTIRSLAMATVAKSKKKTVVPAATAVALFNAALFGVPVPHRLFACAISRQQTELVGEDSKDREFGARLAARTALIKLYFAMNKEVHMSAEKHEGEKNPAYLCGRLLALLDRIHDLAHEGKSASSPANRMYGAASKTPALVFPQLCTLARYHLGKMEGGMAFKLEHGVPGDRRDDGVSENFEGLAAVVARLNESAGGNFPRILSLEEQGRFAIGFYYERCRRWPNFRKEQKSSVTQDGKEN